MVPRRQFLKSAVSLVAAQGLFAAPAAQIHLGCQTNAWPIDARNFASFLAVIQKIRDFGYEGFETSFRNVQDQFERAAEAKSQIDGVGLCFFGVHIFLTQYDPQTGVAPAAMYERVAGGGAGLGAERLILSGAASPDEAARKRKAEALNRAGEFAARLGLELAYHNEVSDMKDNGAEVEWLLRETDPATVWFVLDAGHAYQAGVDVPGFVRHHSQRLTGMHLRDFKNGRQVPLGQGDFPLRVLVQAIRDSGWSGWVLNEEERDQSRPGDAVVKPARDTLFRVFHP